MLRANAAGHGIQICACHPAVARQLGLLLGVDNLRQSCWRSAVVFRPVFCWERANLLVWSRGIVCATPKGFLLSEGPLARQLYSSLSSASQSSQNSICGECGYAH